MTVTVNAEFQERERIVFTARGRSTVNVRRAIDDGPIGFTSIELLLIAFGNCSLGTLLGQPEFEDVAVTSVTAEIEGEMEADPPRLASLRSTVRIATPEPELLKGAVAALRERVLSCPVCNSLNATKEILLEVVRADTPETNAAAAAEVIACALPSAS